jgi:hypothetical protein
MTARAARRFRLAAAVAAVAAMGVWPLSGLQSAPEPAVAPSTADDGMPTLRLLTQAQYENAIASVFGSDIAVKVRLAPVNRVDGLLEVGARTAMLNTGALDPLESSAREIAAQVVEPARRAYLFPCKPADPARADNACAGQFLSRVGRLLYRRPLRQGELSQAVALAGQAAGVSNDFYDGIAYALSGMLVSPEFLFIHETAVPTPAGMRLDAYSKASRLSFLLWNTTPDDELLRAAERGDLDDPTRLAALFDRMTRSPRYAEGVRAFFSDLFVTETFDTLAKDSTIYPAMTLKAVSEAREQMLRIAVDHLVDRHGDYRTLFTTRRTVLSSDLGALYRLPVDLGSQGWTPHEFPADQPRAGILTQIGFLAQYSHPGRSSVTKRGRAIREVLLCQHVPDPPPNVDFSKFENPKSGLHTARERLTLHQENPTCAGCHRLTDPIALSLETFDGAGQFRTTENGAPIDGSGTLDGVAFGDAAGLGKALSESPALKSCIVQRLYGYSLGRKLGTEEQNRVEAYVRALDRSGYRFDQMLRLIVLDPSFFAVRSGPIASPRPELTAFTGGAHAHQDR